MTIRLQFGIALLSFFFLGSAPAAADFGEPGIWWRLQYHTPLPGFVDQSVIKFKSGHRLVVELSSFISGTDRCSVEADYKPIGDSTIRVYPDWNSYQDFRQALLRNGNGVLALNCDALQFMMGKSESIWYFEDANDDAPMYTPDGRSTIPNVYVRFGERRGNKYQFLRDTLHDALRESSESKSSRR